MTVSLCLLISEICSDTKGNLQVFIFTYYFLYFLALISVNTCKVAGVSFSFFDTLHIAERIAQ